MGLTDATDVLLVRGHVDLGLTDATDVLLERGHVPLRAEVIEHFVPAHFESEHKSVEHMDP